MARCNNCGCIIGYTPDDVYANQNLKCPQCGFMMWVPFNPTYDGVVKESEEKKDGETVVSKS